MTSIIKFQPISGVMGDSPPCYILQIDDFRFLLDCGWDEKFDMGFMKELKRHVKQIDAVLLSFPDIMHLGALPYLVGKCDLSCPIYATIPVYKMGQMFMYDLYQSRFQVEEFTLFNLDDVDSAFDKIIQLRYNQTVRMKGKSQDLSIVPMPAGHMLGGTMWKIVKSGEEDIIYTIDFNHKKERHLNACDLQKVSRPLLLITDAYNGTYQHARRRARDEKLMTHILEALGNNGNILIAVDTAGRVLELAHMLDQLWKNKTSGLQAHPLCLLNNVSYNIVEFAKSQIEWMSDKLVKSFESMRDNPFHFKHIILCHSLDEVLKLAKSKAVVLASMPDLECGFGRELFLQWASQPENSIVLTCRTGKGTLGRDLIENGTNRSIPLEVRQRVRLEGEELEEYLKSLQVIDTEYQLSSDDDDDDDDDGDDDDDDDDFQYTRVIKGRHDLLVKPENRKRNFRRYNPLYPLVDKKIKFDDYGELINIDQYKSIEKVTSKSLKRKKDKTKPEIPTKCIIKTKTIDVKAQIHFIDFEGRSDGQSVQQLIAQINPRKLILVRGTPETTETLAEYVRQKTEAKVYTPKQGDIVDVTSEMLIYQIRLTDALASSLKMQDGKDSELAWLDAVAVLPKASLDTVHEQTEEEEILKEDLLTLEPVERTEVDPHDFVFVNELKLSNLRQQLSKKGIDCEFSVGVLWCCNRTIAIKRPEPGKVELDGWFSEQYYKVREILYDQYAIL